MKAFFFVCCALAAFATLPAAQIESVVATAASTLFESTPFILAGTVLARFAPRALHHAGSLFGCGCGNGAPARSLPAAAATALAFGPAVALARFAAAHCAARVLRIGTRRDASCALTDLDGLFPFSVLSGIALAILPRLNGHAALAGGTLAFALALAAPCAYGAIALANVCRHTAPLATTAILCVAGLFDVPALMRPRRGASHDGLAYAICALSCALVAARHGATLVHPHFTVALFCAAPAFAVLALRHRRARCARAWPLAALMLAGAMFARPPVLYYATETTLRGAFAGESIDFTGRLEMHGREASIVRYAITCCRADAAPIAVLLENVPTVAGNGWVRARGIFVISGGTLRLRASSVQPIPAPDDPFVYL
ncbi:MAG: hypothetical protein JOZ38_00510 [Candidatus Eremiobacteraeota bacterium]|nr:hypothetical protein [Candidatus Eremiobacteraeota bacterium]